MFSKFAQAAALCVAAAAMSCGAAERSEVVDTESAALAPTPPVLYITISPGTLSGHPWTVPYDQQRTITLHVEDALGAPAPSGRLVVQFCATREGGPAVSSECAAGGTARWTNTLFSDLETAASFTQSASTQSFGIRFKYSGRGSGFAYGT